MSAAVKPGGGEALVSFFTKLPAQYQVPEEELVVPTNLSRYGLSEVVNRLISLDKPVPFDFLVDGEFLRSSVAQHIESRKLSSEKVLRLEYVFALTEPEQKTVDEAPDWIAAITTLQTFPSQWFAAVSYDGTVRVFEGSETRHTARLADSGLAGLAAWPLASGRGSYLAAAGQDGILRCCSLTYGEKKAGVATGPISSLCAAQRNQALDAVAIHEDGSLLASAGWDHDVFVWNAEPELFGEPEPNAKSGSKRKSASSAEVNPPKFALKGHSQVVTCLHFGSKARFPYTLLSSSWDCSVRVWDIAAASCVCNWPVARAVTSFSLNSNLPPQLVTTHEDGHVSLWDIRAAPHGTVSGAMSLDATAGLPLASAQIPHKRLASQAVWCPEDANRIASVGHDGQLCILDPRSPKMPLVSIQVGKAGPTPTKLLCAAWLSREDLAVGGSDGKVVRVSLSSKLPS